MNKRRVVKGAVEEKRAKDVKKRRAESVTGENPWMNQWHRSREKNELRVEEVQEFNRGRRAVP